MYTIFLCVFYTGWASLFFFFRSSASGLLLFGLGVGFSGFTSGLLFFVFRGHQLNIG